jgi:poly-gamma-glutamate synthesis protein (capsule biosynthesis protein)
VTIVDQGANASTQATRSDPPPRTFSLVAVGDWLPEARVHFAAASFAPPGRRFDHVPLVAPILDAVRSADLAICHVETPIGWPGAPYGFIGRAFTGRSLLAAPSELAGDLKTIGFDRCSTASNHSYDLGIDGIDSTLANLDAVGITHTGTARSPEEAAVTTFDVNGVRVAHVSFALNTNTTFPSDRWRLSYATGPDDVIAAVAAARNAGAEVVVVSLHAFVEMNPFPDPADRALVAALTASSDVDLVVMHGPHVVQPLEIVNGTPVFWSLGNIVSGMGVPGRGIYTDPRALDGLMAAVRFTETDGGRFTAEATPVLLCEMTDTRVVYLGLSALTDPSTPDPARDDISLCIDRSAAVVAGLS